MFTRYPFLLLSLIVLSACNPSNPPDPVDGAAPRDSGTPSDGAIDPDGGDPATCIEDGDCADGDRCTLDRCVGMACERELTPGACADYRQVAGTAALGCGLDADGVVYCWDSGTELWPRPPAPGIPPLTRIEIAEGGVSVGEWDGMGNYIVSGDHRHWACGLEAGGSVWCWDIRRIDDCGHLAVHVQGVSGVRELGVTNDFDEHMGIYMVDGTGHPYYAEFDYTCNHLPMAAEISLADPSLTLREIDLWPVSDAAGSAGLGITEDGRLASISRFIGVRAVDTSTTSLPPLANIDVVYWWEGGHAHFYVVLAEDGRFWRQDWTGLMSTTTVFERIEHAGFTTCGLRADGSLACFGGSNPGGIVPFEELHIYEPPEASMVVIDGVSRPDDFSVAAGHLCVADEGRIRCWGIADGPQEHPLPWNN